MTTRRAIIAAGVLAAAAAFSSAPAVAQKVVLKAADVHPLGYPTVEAVVQMGKKLEKATNGRLDRAKTFGNFLDLRRCGAFGGKAGGLDFDSGAQLHDVEYVAQR